MFIYVNSKINAALAMKYGTFDRISGFSLRFRRRNPAINARECHLRAAECAARAATAPAESMSLEFLNLAARWRAMAMRENFLGQMGTPAPPPHD
jgi:hypothetical protein